MSYYLCRLLFHFLFKALFRFEFTGRENIPKKGGFILASNHMSFLDPVALGIASSRRLSFMARHDLFDNNFSSLILSSWGVLPVKRGFGDISALKEAINLLKGGNALALFPEGRRIIKGENVDPEPGIGFLVSKLDVPVIPAFIKGTDKALPRGARFIRLAKVSVHFGKKISIERRMPYNDIACRIMQDIRHLS
ncbi:MAG: lysophospholipid acyltransferase family protein [Candidatus Omnitrophota bacterium]